MERRRTVSEVAGIALLLASYCSGAHAQSPAGPAAASATDVEFVWGLQIQMRDGVKLSGLLLRPLGAAAPLPVILHFTPYTTGAYLQHGLYLARHGFAFVAVDVRGRGNSGGEFEPFANDGRDGHDVVEWLAVQPWSSGKVGMWGGSYAGFDQWATVKEGPPHLAATAPAASVYPAHDFPRFKNVGYPYQIQWLTLVAGRTSQSTLFGDDRTWVGLFRARYLAGRPFSTLSEVLPSASSIFRKWLDHPTPDAYWDAMVPSPEQYARISTPILTITGHYDDDQPGALRYYREHMTHGTTAAKERHFLVIGPWDHSGTRDPKKEVGGITFGDASLVDLDRINAQWNTWTLAGGERPEFLKKRVAYYVSGAEEWRYSDDLDSVTARRLPLFLHSTQGQAGDAFHSGSLSATRPLLETPDSYVYDPLDVRPATLDAEEKGSFPRIDRYLIDQRGVLDLFGAGLVYHGDSLPEPVEIAGQPLVRAWISMDVPDTDIGVSIYEVKADGTSLLLGSDLVRARYRESVRREQPVPPDVPLLYVFPDFPWIARTLSKGSRIRVTIGALNGIFTERNFNGGGVVAEEGRREARTAHVRVFHESGRESVVELPIAVTAPVLVR